MKEFENRRFDSLKDTVVKKALEWVESPPDYTGSKQRELVHALAELENHMDVYPWLKDSLK